MPSWMEFVDWHGKIKKKKLNHVKSTIIIDYCCFRYEISSDARLISYRNMINNNLYFANTGCLSEWFPFSQAQLCRK